MGNRDEFDASTEGQAYASPGMDTRQWISNGVVENAGGSNGGPVDFSGYVPFVNVRLQPSNIPVRCRVSSHVAGQGEGEWHPFVAGDEVIVAVPGGDERSGCVILGRLNNGIDVWPATMGNQDITQNTFSTKRNVPNYIWEVANGWILTSSTTNAQLALDAGGNWILADGNKNFINLTSNGILLSLGNQSVSLLMDDSNDQLVASVNSGSTFLQLDKTNSTLMTGGTFMVGTAGLLPTQHVVTLENLINWTVNLLVFLGNPVVGDPSTWSSPGKILFPATFPTVLDGLLATMITGSVLPTPPVPPVNGGNLTLFALTQLALAAALIVPTVDSASLTGIPGLFAPGICRPGFKA